MSKKIKKSLEAIIVGTILVAGPLLPCATAKAANNGPYFIPIDPSKKAGEHCAGWQTKGPKYIFHYIPKIAYEKQEVYAADTNGDSLPDTYIWDKNHNQYPEEDEIFYDLNEDGIIDVSHKMLKGEEAEC